MLTSAPVSEPEPMRRPGRRLTGFEEWFWYLLAAVTYIGVATWHKFILNWIMGPAWLVTFVVVGPLAWDRLRRRVGRGARP